MEFVVWLHTETLSRAEVTDDEILEIHPKRDSMQISTEYTKIA